MFAGDFLLGRWGISDQVQIRTDTGSKNPHQHKPKFIQFLSHSYSHNLDRDGYKDVLLTFQYGREA